MPHFVGYPGAEALATDDVPCRTQLLVQLFLDEGSHILKTCLLIPLLVGQRAAITLSTLYSRCASLTTAITTDCSASSMSLSFTSNFSSDILRGRES